MSAGTKAIKESIAGKADELRDIIEDDIPLMCETNDVDVLDELQYALAICLDKLNEVKGMMQ